MAQNKQYYKGLEEVNNTASFQKAVQHEFPEEMSVDQFLASDAVKREGTPRRDFLKYLGFSVTAATIAACETPVIKSVPYANKPEEITPGMPTWYASTYFDGVDFASVMVKTREGRPIFLKGNPHFGLNKGGVSARVNASVLSLYDSARLQGPVANGEATTWSQLDNAVVSALRNAAGGGKKIVVLTGTLASPSAQSAINDFKTAFGGSVQHVTYDPVSASAMRKANERSFGKSMIPVYDFSKARTIVSVNADFLNAWLMSSVYTPQYAQRRNPDGSWMSRHYQFEASMSLTGSNADRRLAIKPSQEGVVLAALYNNIASKSGMPGITVPASDLDEAFITECANSLWSHRGEALVVCGTNNVHAQLLANGINQMLGSYGSTIDATREVFIRSGNDSEMLQLVNDMKSGQVGALLVHGVNPAYTLPNAADFAAALEKVPVSVSFAQHADETAVLCKFIATDSHYLESWNDFYPQTGHYALAQPVISKLYDTRQWQESLLTWAGNPISYLSYVQGVWQKYSGEMAEGLDFAGFWNNALRQGGYELANIPAAEAPSFSASMAEAAAGVALAAKQASGFEVSLYFSTALGDGRHAANPWLQELPDPITKVTWDNYALVSPYDVEEMGLNDELSQESPASVIAVKIGDRTVELPVYPAPGQKKGTIGVALGYGRGANGENIGKAAYRTAEYGGYEKTDDDKLVPIGVNVYPLLGMQDGDFQYSLSGASVEKTDKEFALASTQIQHTIMGRDSVLKETTLTFYRTNEKEAWNHSHKLPMHENGETVLTPVKEIDLWESFPVEEVGHRWGLNVDLNLCIGCGACVTACHSENNVPVVGKDEIRRGRDMHWMRIDRYFSSATETLEAGMEDGTGTIGAYRKMEKPDYENPSTVHMPMMCQHCNHAPCETVCPVAATTHSNEGLNQMTYNRCIGTRYCANNCPYKVRRFNWFNYRAYDKFAQVNPAQDTVMRMVLNPDVTVRSRGVMEKCTFCVQRIQYGKLEAKKAGEPLKDGMVTSACAEACPTQAITFGDVNDTKSRVRAKMNENRTYFALEEVGVQPNVSYQVKVRNEELV